MYTISHALFSHFFIIKSRRLHIMSITQPFPSCLVVFSLTLELICANICIQLSRAAP